MQPPARARARARARPWSRFTCAHDSRARTPAELASPSPSSWPSRTERWLQRPQLHISHFPQPTSLSNSPPTLIDRASNTTTRSLPLQHPELIRTAQITRQQKPQWTRPRSSSRCRASSSRTAGSSLPGAASVRLQQSAAGILAEEREQGIGREHDHTTSRHRPRTKCKQLPVIALLSSLCPSWSVQAENLC